MARLSYVALKVSTKSWGSIGFPEGTWRLGATCVPIEETNGSPTLGAGVLEHEGVLVVAGLHTVHEQTLCALVVSELGLESMDHLMVRARDSESTLQSLSRSLGSRRIVGSSVSGQEY